MIKTAKTYSQQAEEKSIDGLRADPFAIYELNSSNELTQLGKAERLRHFEILWLKEAQGCLCLDETSFPLDNDTLYCLGPGQMRRLRADSPMVGYYMRIAPEFLHLVHDQFDVSFMLRYSAGKIRPVSMTQEETTASLEDVVMRLLHEFNNSNSAMRMELIKGFLKIFIIYLSEEFLVDKEEALDRNTLILRKFAELLKSHATIKKLVSDYADDLCVTPNYLNSIVKKITGLTVSHHIQQHIVQEAKRQAIYSGMRMKEIAYQLGFEDQAHFSKFFKNYSGTNFSAFRKGAMTGGFARM